MGNAQVLAHALPTICPQLQITGVKYRDVIPHVTEVGNP
jgi:hypothetical protein